MRASDVFIVSVTAGTLAAPLVGLTWVADAFNDKLDGPQATALSYLKVLSVGLGCALLIRLMIPKGMASERAFAIWIIAAPLIACLLVITFCLWWRDGWVMEEISA